MVFDPRFMSEAPDFNAHVAVVEGRKVFIPRPSGEQGMDLVVVFDGLAQLQGVKYRFDVVVQIAQFVRALGDDDDLDGSVPRLVLLGREDFASRSRLP